MMKKKHKNQDDPEEIEDVRRQELSRGRGYVSSQEEREATKQKKQQWRDILRAMKWEEVVIALLLREGTEEYDEMHRTWLRYRRDSDSRQSY